MTAFNPAALLNDSTINPTTLAVNQPTKPFSAVDGGGSGMITLPNGPTDMGGFFPSPHSVDVWSSPPGNENPFGPQDPFNYSPGNFDPSSAFDAFNLPSYTGPMSAPITEGMFNALQGIKNTANANPIGMTQDTMNAISSMLSGSGFAPAGMDPNSIMARFRPDVQGLSDMINTGFQTVNEGDVPYSNTGQSSGVINSILSGAANNNVDPRTKQLQDATLSAFLTASNPQRFDTTALFNNLNTVFEHDLAKQTADMKEQYSGMGLAPGATDRLDAIATNAGEARAKHNAALQQIGMQAFNDAENRRLQAIGEAAGVGNLMNTGTANAQSVIGAIMSNERLPFDQKMQFVSQVLEPAAQRKATGVTTQADLSNSAMNRYEQERQMAEQAKQAALDAAVATRGQDITQRGQDQAAANNLFNAEGFLRDAADQEAVRNYNEFVRTQGGGLNQALDFLKTLPEGTVAVGPSTASQVGEVAGQVVDNLPELIKEGKVVWNVFKKAWDWATK